MKPVVTIHCVTGGHEKRIGSIVDSDGGPRFVVRYREFRLTVSVRDGAPEATEYGGGFTLIERDEPIEPEGAYITGCETHGKVTFTGADLLEYVRAARESGKPTRVTVTVEPPGYRMVLGPG